MPTKTNPAPDSRSRELSTRQRETLLTALRARFDGNEERHRGLKWGDVQSRLDANPDKLWSLHEMDRTGGEPDVVGNDRTSKGVRFVDCSSESPAGRRNLCYDQEALESRKANKPRDSAVGMAGAMGIQLLTEEEYRRLQELGAFDTKTSSWVQTPPRIRKLGGALFCDRRFDHVFVYHNHADSYYAARGFRGSLEI
jgi:hypothetical protein